MKRNFQEIRLFGKNLDKIAPIECNYFQYNVKLISPKKLIIFEDRSN